jgi:hypothetical protein
MWEETWGGKGKIKWSSSDFLAGVAMYLRSETRCEFPRAENIEAR